ncbi:MAG TPA: lipase maturation factor family protein [Amnibacterium sp.]|nr:lipase maturation factor family protein [Amnibacterium sp.]
MDLLTAPDAEFARQVLQRGTAAVYLLAFVSTLRQFPALLGEHGLLPVPRYLRIARPGPTLFRRRYSDRLLTAVCVAGIAVAALLVVGLPQRGPDWLPMLAFLLLYGLYLSIVHVGQTFYGFGWEMLLCEAGFTVAFLGSDGSPPPRLILLAVLWLVFRLEFGAGLIKLRGDPAWRDLTALYYHHETQPMPNPLSRTAHLMPGWWHRLEVIGNHVAQLVAPILLFLPQPVASIAGLVMILTQAWLIVTGNFAWLNVLTIVLACAALGDRTVHAVLPFVPVDEHRSAALPLYWLVITTLVAAGLLVLAYRPARNLLSRNQLMNAAFNRWNLGNAYGAFGSVTRQRDEVVIEGTTEPLPGEGDWREYQFYGKPGEVDRRPPQVAPYHLRLDWLLWFVPLGAARAEWFAALLLHLLEADPRILRHVRVDPFGGERPRLIRVRMFRYRFATRAEHRVDRAFWVRRPLYVLVPPIGAEQLRRALR